MSVSADNVVALQEARDVLKADTVPHLTKPSPLQIGFSCADFHMFIRYVLPLNL